MALKKVKVWGTVSGNKSAPVEDTVDEMKGYYASRWDKALATIVFLADLLLLYLLGNPDNPVCVWRKLEEQYQNKFISKNQVLQIL